MADKQPRRPLKERTAKGEKIGGGFFVFGRHTTTGRVRINQSGLPFEHATFAGAVSEAVRLSRAYRGKRFVVLQQVHSTMCVEPDNE